MKVRCESYSCREVVVSRVKGTGMPIYDTVANLEIADMIDKGWLVQSAELELREHRHDPSRGYRNRPGYVNVPDVVKHIPRLTVLFVRDEP